MYIFFKLSEPQAKLGNMLKILEIPPSSDSQKCKFTHGIHQ